MPSEVAALAAEFGRPLHDRQEVAAQQVCSLCGNTGRRHVGLDPETCQPRYKPCVCVLDEPE